MQDKTNRTRPTLKDVAELSGYALRTVKKVMNREGSVSDKANAAVLDAANKLNYKRNNHASALARRRDIKIAIVYSVTTKAYFPEIKQGFERGSEHYRDYGMTVEYFIAYNKELQKQTEILQRILNDSSIDGVIIQPISANNLNTYIDALVDKGIPVITFGADAPESKRLCYIGPDAYKAGRIGAQVLANYIGKNGNVFIVSQSSEHMQTAERVRGFTEHMKEHYPNIEVFTLNIPDNSDLYYEMVKAIVTKENIKALFCTDANAYVAGEILRDLKRTDIVVIGFDISEMAEVLMRSGYLKVMIDQTPSMIAYVAIQQMFNYIFNNEMPEEKQYTNLAILTSECL